MSSSRAIWVGAVGTVIAVICCFTPAMVILLGAVGLSALTGYIDVVLLPALGVFVLLLIYGVVQRARS
jgi:mercuric ion transport protein